MKQITLFLILSVIYFLTSAQTEGKWINLFDGKTLNGWKKGAGDAEYKVENGTIAGTTVVASSNSFLITEKEYDNFVLELEAKIDDTTSNSGIQLRSHVDPNGNNGKGKVFGYQYELDPSSRKWSAGIYDEGRRDWLYPLSLNHAAQDLFKLNEYNKIRVECFGNTIRTWINGQPAAVLIDTFDKKGFIGLQVHAVSKAEDAGKKVYFKNIRLMPIAKPSADFPTSVYVMDLIPNNLSAYEKKNGWKLLFDGMDSKGWKGAYKDHFPDSGWQVKDGLLTVLASAGKEGGVGGDIVTTGQFRAFDLSFDFKLSTGANSGVKYFVTLNEHNQGSAIGLEYQLLDDKVHPDAKLGRDGDRTLSSLYDLIPAQKQERFIHPIGQWNMGRIIVYPNNHVEHYLNGVKVLEYERGSQAFRDLVAISKFKVWDHFGEAPKGFILLQDHGFEVSFRSIKIRELK
ncbi:MAG TPA: DUF1080 domain-containing protein [Chitinophagaceae bacterium]|nr:DUF1080 domain-containing protein [Chitinophagaceae bacterium]